MIKQKGFKGSLLIIQDDEQYQSLSDDKSAFNSIIKTNLDLQLQKNQDD